ncbi:MAG: hypothetical protein CM15mP49_06140 [Actinomycetota bacterium]|nr:MAG: hypothetical protein CM15mP49_06140 [Actinomycetota bacterium]
MKNPRSQGKRAFFKMDFGKRKETVIPRAQRYCIGVVFGSWGPLNKVVRPDLVFS